MTVQFTDTDEIGLIKYFARCYTFCVKHRIRYEGLVTTAGLWYVCPKCNEEWIEKNRA